MSALQNDQPNLQESDVSSDSWDGQTTDYLINDALSCPPNTEFCSDKTYRTGKQRIQQEIFKHL